MESKKSQEIFREVGPRVEADELERGILAYWEKAKIFEKTLKKPAKDNFVFYDGPPYATGTPHFGHVLQSAIKDTVLRYKTMRGFHVPRRVGWDCHGLPVETLVEKEMGFKGKKEIEAFGIENFNTKCRETVFRYIDVFTDTLKRLGRWAEYDQAYATLDRDYMESEWWVFKQLWEQGLVYKAFRSTPYCIRCATPLSNFEVSMAYRDKVDRAVYALLPLIQGSPTSLKLRGADQKLWLLIWTTTPWTLPGNAAVAYSADAAVKYAVVNYDGRRIVVAKDRVEAVFGRGAVIEREMSGKELAELGKYEALYPEVAKNLNLTSDKLFILVPAEHVNMEDGTGLVHMAPAFGEEDAEVGQREGLPLLRTVDTQGRYEDSVSKWAGENIFVANGKIIADLEARGMLFKQEQYTHSYPYCWRCDTPLIYYALDTWFIRISEIKSRMLESNEQINWIPGHVKKGRFGKGIESAPDWAVSRNRYWSVPLPVWECDRCEERVCVGSIKELRELSGERGIKDLHRPYVDEITWRCGETPLNPPLLRGENDASCSGMMKRVSEVLDVWFDAGSMPYSQGHYPWENQQAVKDSLPADFIVESVEQTRAWFYVLHVLATALTGKDIGLGRNKPAYKNVIASGLIFAEDGQKLSKKLKNYPELDSTLKTYGADVLRLYLLSSTALGEPYRFSEKELRQVKNSVYMTWWNVYSFFVRYALVAKWDPALHQTLPPNLELLDKWMMARLKKFERDIVQLTDGYQVDKAAQQIGIFIGDLSNWYIRRSRKRFQVAGVERLNEAARSQAFNVLYQVLVRSAKMMAAYLPFVSEEIYRNLTGGPSVHLEELREAEKLTEDEEALLERMALMREVVSQALALRAGVGIKVRQPLKRLIASGEPWEKEMVEIVKEEVNVKAVEFAEALPAAGELMAVAAEDGRGRVALDLEITEALEQEGIARELVRQGQVLRRQVGYELNDRIILMAGTDAKGLAKAFAAQEAFIKNALQADEMVSDLSQPDAERVIKIQGMEVRLGVKRI